MLEKSTMVIGGEEYNFLKPYACDLIDIEDQSFDGGSFDSIKFSKLMLGLVSQKIKIEDLVKLSIPEVTLSSGDVVSVEDIGYEKHTKTLSGITKKTRSNFCKEFLKASGIEGNVDLKAFTYEDINKCADAFIGMYDDSELNKAVESISGFCLSSEKE